MKSTNYKELLSMLELQHDSLRFSDFTFETAHTIGLYIIQKSKELGKSLTVDITIGQHQIFHFALEGTSHENDEWIIRKNRVANKFKKSSYYVSILLKCLDKNIEEEYGLDPNDYAAFGGAYPILLNNGDFIGTITVSGLPDYEDHEMVVNAIKWYLDNK